MELISGIHLIENTFCSRIYLLEGKSLAIVDSGMPWDYRPVLRYIQSIGRRPRDLRHILITHSHPDHAGGAPKLRQLVGAKIIAHTNDTRKLSDGQSTVSYLGVFGSMNMHLPFLQRAIVDYQIVDGEVLDLFGGIKVIHTPGHTPGSVCYFVESKGVLFSGDTLFSDGNQVSRTLPFPGHNKHSYRISVANLATLEFNTLCGGHGKPLMSNGSDRLKEMLLLKPDSPSWGNVIRKSIKGLVQS